MTRGNDSLSRLANEARMRRKRTYVRYLSCLGCALLALALLLGWPSTKEGSLRRIPSGIMLVNASKPTGLAARFTPGSWKVFHMKDYSVPEQPLDWLSLGPLQLYRAPTNASFR